MQAAAGLSLLHVHPTHCRADLVVSTETEDLVQRSREVTKGRGSYTALDPVAGTFTDVVSRRVALHTCSRTMLSRPAH
jgi:hypothetical protein